jgi:hypothetical protein
MRRGAQDLPVGSVDGVSQPLELVLDSQFLFFEGDHPQFIPVGIGHLVFDDVLDFLVLVGQVIDMSLYRHACTSSFDFGRLARALSKFEKLARARPKIQPPKPAPVIPKGDGTKTLCPCVKKC